ncbi:MAG: nuclear transport factor 2 family protein [Mycobacterium sp.]
MTNPTLDERIRRLEDIEALKQLKSRYAGYCDDDYDADRLGPLFTQDAIWDGGVLGRYQGRGAIRAFFAGASKSMPFAIHHVTNPVVEVDGDRATGQWHLWQPCVHAAGAQALWIAGRYHDEYRREGGEWRFAKVTIRLNMISPYEAGWSRARMIAVPA